MVNSAMKWFGRWWFSCGCCWLERVLETRTVLHRIEKCMTIRAFRTFISPRICTFQWRTYVLNEAGRRLISWLMMPYYGPPDAQNIALTASGRSAFFPPNLCIYKILLCRLMSVWCCLVCHSDVGSFTVVSIPVYSPNSSLFLLFFCILFHSVRLCLKVKTTWYNGVRVWPVCVCADGVGDYRWCSWRTVFCTVLFVYVV